MVRQTTSMEGAVPGACLWLVVRKRLSSAVMETCATSGSGLAERMARCGKLHT